MKVSPTLSQAPVQPRADRPQPDAATTAGQPVASQGFDGRFDNRFARELEGAYVPWPPSQVPAPALVALNGELAAELGLDATWLASPQGLAVLAGNAVPAGAQPLAQAYAGHQFGNFSPQLGDGRALLLGELIDVHGRRRDIALKGSGRTPFSRGGDGKAALGPVLREFVLGEAMHSLGIPTTRALAAVATGEAVLRDQALPGAVLTRVAASHVRVGSFQYFSSRDEPALLQRLADHVISRHDPDLAEAAPGERYLALLQRVAQRQAALIARWMGVGFIHGVMNTDNMSISGQTIDYGPCAFMEAYDPRAVFSSIDRQGRYAYGNQPAIAQWNIARLAEALLPLIDADADRAVERAAEVVHGFVPAYQARWTEVMGAKLGLTGAAAHAEDAALADDYLTLLHQHGVDFSLGFRRLFDAASGRPAPLHEMFGPEAAAPLQAWLDRWQPHVAQISPAALAAMREANPALIARNHQVEAALSAAVANDDMAPFKRLLAALRQPFDERPEDADLALPAPAEVTAGYKTFCGT